MYACHFVARACRGWSSRYYIFWLYVCSLTYPACKAHVQHLYCHLWPIWLYHIFPHYLTKSTNFEEKMIEEKMCVLIFSTSLTEIFLIIRKIEEDIIINLHTTACQVAVTLVIFELNFNFLDRFSKNTQI